MFAEKFSNREAERNRPRPRIQRLPATHLKLIERARSNRGNTVYIMMYLVDLMPNDISLLSRYQSIIVPKRLWDTELYCTRILASKLKWGVCVVLRSSIFVVLINSSDHIKANFSWKDMVVPPPL